MHTSTYNLCGLKPSLGQTEVPNPCRIQYIKLTNSIFNWFSKVNVGLYVANNESIAINCCNGDAFNVFLNETGKITLDEVQNFMFIRNKQL